MGQSPDISQYTSAALDGSVTDYNGLAVSNAFIQVAGAEQASTFTEANGHYELIGLEAGNYTISVTPDPYDNLMPASTSASLSVGETTTCDFVLSPAGSIAGKVTDADGNPVPDVALHLSGYEPPVYATNEEGKYIIPSLQAGTYTVNIDSPGLGPWYISVNHQLVGYGSSAAVEVTLGETTWVDFSLRMPPITDIWVDPNLFEILAAKGMVVKKELVIGNSGNGVLEFDATDLQGVVVKDPSEGYSPDIKQVVVGIDPNEARFVIEGYTPISDLYSYIWLDMDQDPGTGVTEAWWPGVGLNDIGAEYVLVVNVWSGYGDGYLYRWSGGWFDSVAYLPVTVLSGQRFAVDVQLSDIGDDGEFDFTVMGEYLYRDIVPDVGHGTLGGVGYDWLSLSPDSGMVESGQEMEAVVTIDTADLSRGMYERIIAISSNDFDEPLVYIPVLLEVTAPPVAVRTVAATDIGKDSVRLWGEVVNDGGEDCWCRFSYFKEGEGVRVVSTTPWIQGLRAGEVFSQVVEGLEPGTKYWFWAEAMDPRHWQQTEWGSGLSECFTTLKGLVEVRAPKGGENWFGGSTQTVQWGADPAVSQVVLEYSVDNGATWYDLAVLANTEENKKYPWVVPDADSTQCLMRVSDAKDLSVADVSDGVFCITRCLVPRLVGMFVNDAQAALAAAGLTLGAVKEQYATWPTCGTVMHQVVPEGTPLAAGSPVDLLVAGGAFGPGGPTMSTQAATDVGSGSAKVWGKVLDDDGEWCRYRFHYWPDLRQVRVIQMTTWKGYAKKGQSFSEVITGLKPGTKYYFWVQGMNSTGRSESSEMLTFTTAP